MTALATMPESPPEESVSTSGHAPAEHPTREVRHEYSRNFPALLEQLNVSLVVSTYQAGKVVVVGQHEGQLSLAYHNFERAMGLAFKRGVLAVGARSQVWLLRGRPDLAPQVEPLGRHDACFLTRSSQFTGEIQAHELAWSGEELWVVNTAFSCLCTLHADHSFEPRWQPSFISTLAPEDRCHLNGMVLVDGKPKYVTALAETDTAQGWRANKATSGCLIDVGSGQIIARGFAMPHSPRVYQDHVWMLHSGMGRLVLVDLASGKVETVTELPGYTRGLTMHGPYAFIGLSKIRETATFGGVPIAADRDKLKCGVGVVDLRSGKLVAHVEFLSGVEEIFDVAVLPGIRCPVLSGPYPTVDGGQPIWTVPTIRPGG